MNKLKIGIILENHSVPNWKYDLIRKILEISYLDLCLNIVIDSNPNPDNKVSRIRELNSISLWKIYKRFDEFLFKNSSNLLSEFEMNDLINKKHPSIETLIVKNSNELFEQTVAYKIKHSEVHVLINLSKTRIKKNVNNLIKYGVWSLYCNDFLLEHDDLIGAKEVFYDESETTFSIQIQMDDSDNINLFEKSSYSTERLSVYRNKKKFYQTYSSSLLWNLREVFLKGERHVMLKAGNSDPGHIELAQQTSKFPENYRLFKIIFKKYINKLIQKLNDILYFNQWILIYDFDIEVSDFKNKNCFKQMIPPKDKFWADPFIIEKKNRYYIFIEELMYKTNKGHISVIEMDFQGNYSDPVKVLEKDYHLSYPFIIEEDGVLYMIPETSQDNRISMYKCTDFPYKWEMEIVLIDNIEAVDTTIIKHSGQYWLFTNIKNHEGISLNGELFLFYSDNLKTNNWKQHFLNPVISDVKRARSAGSLFLEDDKLYRPSQNCSTRYGFEIFISYLPYLDKNRFSDVIKKEINPVWDKNILATHTYNNLDNFTIIDALMKRRRYF